MSLFSPLYSYFIMFFIPLFPVHYYFPSLISSFTAFFLSILYCLISLLLILFFYLISYPFYPTSPIPSLTLLPCVPFMISYLTVPCLFLFLPSFFASFPFCNISLFLPLTLVSLLFELVSLLLYRIFYFFVLSFPNLFEFLLFSSSISLLKFLPSPHSLLPSRHYSSRFFFLSSFIPNLTPTLLLFFFLFSSDLEALAQYCISLASSFKYYLPVIYFVFNEYVTRFDTFFTLPLLPFSTVF